MERELLLLGLLRREDMHGYRLHEYIQNNMASCTDLKKPTAYNLLEKMVGCGWLAAIPENDPTSKRPPRRVYTITANGEAAFQQLLRENLSNYHDVIFSDDIGLAFIDAIPLEEAHALLRQRRERIKAERDIMQHVPEHTGSMGYVIEHRIIHLESELQWLDSILTRLQEERD